MENHLVTDAKSLIGFTQGGHHDRGGYWQQAYGVSDKDQGYASTVDAGERTRDVLAAIYGGVVATEKVGAAAVVATEKTGAASVLATEKVGSAAVIETVRSTQLLQVQAERINQESFAQAERIRGEIGTQAERYQIANTLALTDMRLEAKDQACRIEAKLAECCSKLEAQMLAIEANRVRDDLAQCRAELLAFRASGNGNGNNGNNRV